MEGEGVLPAPKNRVVVVGGGVAGGFLAKSLQLSADVTLIDSKEYFEIPWANMRSMVEPSFSERSLVKHIEYFTNGRLIISHAVNVTENEVLTEDGHSVAYDYLIIATGHADSTPESRKERMKQFEQGNQTRISCTKARDGGCQELEVVDEGSP